MAWVHLAVAVLFAILGVVFLNGKGADLIAGYNTASEEEKLKTDEKKLCRFVGKLMFAVAACFLVAAAGGWLHSKAVLWSGLALLVAVVAVGLILLNTGHRFDKD